MQDLTREAMLELVRSAAQSRSVADRLGRNAAALAAAGRDEEAAAYVAATRNHRVRALKDEAMLAGLTWRHGPLHQG